MPPQLSTLDLCGCSKLASLELCAPRLERLLLSGCTRLEQLELQCPELNALFLRGCECCPQASPVFAHLLARSPWSACSRLAHRSPFLQDTITRAVSASPKLRTLDLTSCSQLRDLTLAHGALQRVVTFWCAELQARCGRPQRPHASIAALAVDTPAHVSQSATIDCPRLDSLTLQQLPSTLLTVLPPAPTLTHLHFAQLQVMNRPLDTARHSPP